jgi:hypothetical protein
LTLIATETATDARAKVVQQLWLNAQVSREEIFGPLDRLPQGARSDARDMWAGYVGPDYLPGSLVLVAHYPAGGTTPYADTDRAVRDAPFYKLIADFKRSDPVARAATFEALNSHVAEALPKWRMHKVIRIALEAAGVSLAEVALLNLVPYRIAGNVSPNAAVVNAAWLRCTSAALQALRPGMVGALGSLPGRALAVRNVSPLFIFPRTIGDTYVHPKAYEVARLLAAARGAPFPSGSIGTGSEIERVTSRAAPRGTAKRSDIDCARVHLGPNVPLAKSVHGIIRAVVAGRSGLSGAELLAQLRDIDFSGIPSPHTAHGTPEDSWFIGYIRGGLKRGFLKME